MAKRFSLAAEPREGAGKGASRRLRRGGRVPGIIYGGGVSAQSVSFDANTLLLDMAHESFFTSILNVNLGGETMQAIVRDYQVHPAKRAVLHLDLQRIVATEKLTLAVPLHFINETTCKAVKDAGGSVSHLLTEIEVSCLPKDLPGYIEVDIGPMELNQMLHLSDLTLPAGVEIPGLVAGSDSDLPVVHVHVLRAAAEPAAEEGAESAAPAEAAGDKEAKK